MSTFCTAMESMPTTGSPPRPPSIVGDEGLLTGSSVNVPPICSAPHGTHEAKMVLSKVSALGFEGEA